jgi:CTP:molybdopterin cytidylyltransferase MocA
VTPAPGRSTVGPVAGIVLAAGAGTRYGGPKALVEVDGDRLVDRAARLLRAGGCAPVVVVLGAAVVDVPGADAVVVNEAWPEGMGSSLVAGLRSSALARCSAAVVVLVDQPGLTATAVRRLLDAHLAGAGLAAATYGGERGHPVLLGRAHWPGVVDLAVGDVGARPYLRAHEADVVAVPCDDVADGRDVDTPDELARPGLLDRLRGDGSSAGLAAGLGELGALLGGSGARARLDEEASEAARRETQGEGAPPFDVDLDAGIARIRRPPRR